MTDNVVISCPYGNYLNYKGAISTLGTFTKEYRGGIIKRLWRMALTMRYNRRQQSWINKLGLPNPGIQYVIDNANKIDFDNSYISIHGFNENDWYYLVSRCENLIKCFEFNLSCPNVGYNHLQHLKAVENAISFCLRQNIDLICKLSPVRWMEYGIPLYSIGVRKFHLCNTIQTPGGGISGKPLKQYSLWALDDFKSKWGEDVGVISGGGISNIDDAKEFIDHGADKIALGSMLNNPINTFFRVQNLIGNINKLFEERLNKRIKELLES